MSSKSNSEKERQRKKGLSRTQADDCFVEEQTDVEKVVRKSIKLYQIHNFALHRGAFSQNFSRVIITI